MKLSKVERETIITWNDGEPMANVYTTSPAVRRRLTLRVGEPTKILGAYAAEWDIPRKWLKLPLARKPTKNLGRPNNLRGGGPHGAVQ